MTAPIVAPTIAVVRPPSFWLLELAPFSPILVLLLLLLLLLGVIEVLVVLLFWLNGSLELKECVIVIWLRHEVSLLLPVAVNRSEVPY